MVGGGHRRDEGSLPLKNTNVFAALETLRKKKKSDKKSKGSSKAPEPPQQAYWAPPLLTKSWADVEDEDDDDYLAHTAPIQPVWGSSEPQPSKHKAPTLEESESEEDILDEGDDDEEDHELETEAPVQAEPVVKKPAGVPAPPKDAEKQLSKKEKRKLELAELEALLADFGVTQKESDRQDESRGVAHDKGSASNGDVEKKENHPAESKISKKKKKKDKASKDAKESHDQPNNSGVSNRPSEAEHTEEDVSTVDVKERLKKVAAAKKKKGTKELDAAAKAAAQEATARRAKLAAAKKKEKNHYNQQPVR